MKREKGEEKEERERNTKKASFPKEEARKRRVTDGIRTHDIQNHNLTL